MSLIETMEHSHARPDRRSRDVLLSFTKSGIGSCATRTFNTANGPAQGCVAKASKIQIGGFVLRDFEVAVMPNLPTDALLGMNIMRMLRLEQQNGVMCLSIR